MSKSQENNNLNAAEALQKLLEGNQRFINGLRSIDSLASVQRVRELAEKGQKPFAVVLTCSDSRVPTETVFDCGLGDIFVIRVAGNITGPALIASIEFAAANFGTSLCIVMGHSQCGAIAAAIKAETNSTKLSPNLKKLVGKIQPAVKRALKVGELPAGELEHLTSVENVLHSVNEVTEKSASLRKLVKEGKFTIVGAYYNVHTGLVDVNLKHVEHLLEKGIKQQNGVIPFRMRAG